MTLLCRLLYTQHTTISPSPNLTPLSCSATGAFLSCLPTHSPTISTYLLYIQHPTYRAYQHLHMPPLPTGLTSATLPPRTTARVCSRLPRAKVLAFFRHPRAIPTSEISELALRNFPLVGVTVACALWEYELISEAMPDWPEDLANCLRL